MSSSARIQDFEYLYASNINVSYFVTVKLSGKNNYHVWKSQFLCLLDSNNMGGIVDATFARPRYSGTDTVRLYDTLARGWIFGSVSEDVLAHVHNLGTAKSVWEALKSVYDPPISLPEESTLKRPDAEIEKVVDGDPVSANSIEIIVPKDPKTTNEDSIKKIQHTNLCEATAKDWSKVESILKNITKEEVLQQRDTDGSTALHIAAIVGNKDAAVLLVRKNSELLRIKDNSGEVPLQKAYENMHLDTIAYLLEASEYNEETQLLLSSHDSVHCEEEIGIRLLVNAISAKEYSLASEWVRKLPMFVSKTDHVLLALAKTFPTGLDYGETLIYPSSRTWKDTKKAATYLKNYIVDIPSFCGVFSVMAEDFGYDCVDGCAYLFALVMGLPFFAVTLVVIVPLVIAAYLAYLLIMIFCLFIRLPYYLLWSIADALAVGPVRRMKKKKKAYNEAKEVLELVCKNIDSLENLDTHHPHYNRLILEAASHNASKVVDEILFRSPEAIESTNESGYDIIQLAILNRSEKIYNLIYDIGERQKYYRTYVDSFGNNILHLAGKLAPSNVLDQRTGAALQLQRELKWREEVKKVVFPTYITQENMFGETPDTIFTREHENLVKEGEQWMKTTAESCSITAALIITIVFAAAITVPGGSNQEKGTPLFKKETAFIIFAVSDAISLFASTTSLLVFLSILTARFAENDFLFSLPSRLFIGLFTLLLSTTALMVAFSSTVFLVFCDKTPAMLILICGLAVIPIASFVTLQSPLVVDLFRSTYIDIFGRKKDGFFKLFNPEDIRLRFGKWN